MNIITVENIDIELIRKNIKNIHIKIYSPDGRVRMTLPERMDDEDARFFIMSKLSWILKQKKKFLKHQSQLNL